jgi:hypothetical protein
VTAVLRVCFCFNSIMQVIRQASGRALYSLHAATGRVSVLSQKTRRGIVAPIFARGFCPSARSASSAEADMIHSVCHFGKKREMVLRQWTVWIYLYRLLKRKHFAALPLKRQAAISLCAYSKRIDTDLYLRYPRHRDFIRDTDTGAAEQAGILSI